MIWVVVLGYLAAAGAIVLMVLAVGVRNKVNDVLVEIRVLEERREELKELIASVQLSRKHHEQTSQKRANPKQGNCTISDIGLPKLLIVLFVALLLFGDSHLAGLGKGVGRPIRGFKEEVKSVESLDQSKGKSSEPEVAEAEIVDEKVAGLERRQRGLEARRWALKETELKARGVALNAREAEAGNQSH